MPKCPKCGGTFSPSVLPMHLKRCGVVPKEEPKKEPEKVVETVKAELDRDQLKAEADKLGLKYAHNISNENLKLRIEEVKGLGDLNA